MQVANALLHAFDTETGIPKSTINLATGMFLNFFVPIVSEGFVHVLFIL